MATLTKEHKDLIKSKAQGVILAAKEAGLNTTGWFFVPGKQDATCAWCIWSKEPGVWSPGYLGRDYDTALKVLDALLGAFNQVVRSREVVNR